MNDFENLERRSTTEEELFFDSVVGKIEEILMDSDFQKLHQDFMEEYWHYFDNSDENKLCYMSIFTKYVDVIEKYIENDLARKIPNFSMERFISIIRTHKNELDGEVFEMLFTFTDFLSFKEMFLDYKAVKEGAVDDLSSGISVTPLHS